MAATGRRSSSDRTRASLMPTWSPDCQWVAVGVGTFFGGRGFAPANVFVVKADGSESRQLTQSTVNSGYPAWHPDGKTLIYRVWGTEDVPEKRGLRALDMTTNADEGAHDGWDNFPFISPERRPRGVHAAHAELRFRGLHDEAGRHRREAVDHDAGRRCARDLVGTTARRSGSRVRARASRTKRRCTTPRRSPMRRSTS